MKLIRVLGCIALAAMISASLHICTHIVHTSSSELEHSLVFNIPDGGEQPIKPVINGSHSCIACQTLNNLKINSPAVFVLPAATDSHFHPHLQSAPHSDALSLLHSGRAPPHS